MSELKLVNVIDKRSPVCVDEEFLNNNLLTDNNPNGLFKLTWSNHRWNKTVVLDCMFGYNSSFHKPFVFDSFFVTGIDKRNHDVYVLRIFKSKIFVLYPGGYDNIKPEDVEIINEYNNKSYTIDKFFTREQMTEYKFVSNVEDILEIGKAYRLVHEDGTRKDVIYTGIDYDSALGDSIMVQFYDSKEEACDNIGGMYTAYVSAENIGCGKVTLYEI